MRADLHEDYSPPLPTERHRAADAVAALLFASGLYEGEGPPLAERSAHGRCYVIRLKRTDPPVKGAVLVFSPTYFQVQWKCRVPMMPAEGSRVFGSLEEAGAFVELAFATCDPELALQIPQRQPARK